MKLTKPQKDLLKSVGTGGNAVESYPPTKKLLSAGLIEIEKIGFGSYLRLTAAGRAALAKLEDGE
ncbi:MAG: hypothetical protein DI589_12125 [Shinella sp.]|nr:MAG: hypothetical protein DI589_12125 [Shinella sp.]